MVETDICTNRTHNQQLELLKIKFPRMHILNRNLKWNLQFPHITASSKNIYFTIPRLLLYICSICTKQKTTQLFPLSLPLLEWNQYNSTWMSGGCKFWHYWDPISATTRQQLKRSLQLKYVYRDSLLSILWKERPRFSLNVFSF